ncbi:hypothetical protein [Pseudarthrobacter sp. CCNWLW207]|uniref:hypothetical protein n=1 Tax=Pseudarthrobacter sp. CCNWLW207 TaxID=3127468 RepID=UPI003076B5ED
MRQVRIGDAVQLIDGAYRVTDYSSGQIMLQSLEDGAEVAMDSSMMALQLQDARGRVTAPHPRALDLAKPEARRRALLWADHLDEVLTGRQRRGKEGEPRVAYDPSLTLHDRLASKARELQAMGLPCSVSTLKRKLRAYRVAGAAGLLDGRQLRRDPPLSHVDPRVVEALVSVIAGETNQSTATRERFRYRLRKELLRKYPGEDVVVPPRTSLWRYTTILTKGKYTFGSAWTRRSAATVPGRMFNHRLRFFPGQEVQMDSTKPDFLALDSLGRRRKVVMTIMVDTTTEKVVASTIRLGGTKGFDHTVCLARCLVPRGVRPGYPRLKAAVSTIANGTPATPEGQPEGALLQPFIFPHRIVTDNGKDYLSEVFRAACAKYGISLTEASLHTGSDKPIVERCLESIKTEFSQYLGGYTGGSTIMRGAHPEREDVLDIYTLNEVFEDWLENVWDNRPRKGLSDALFPGVVMSARAMTIALHEVTGEVPVPFTQNDFIDLMPIHLLTIQPKGITHQGRTYDSVRLFPFRLQPCPETHSRKWPVHYNPYDPFAVWVKHPDDGTWIECTWTGAGRLSTPFSSFVRREGRRIAEEIGVLDNDRAVELTMDIIQHGQQEQDRMANMQARSKVALEYEKANNMPIPTMPETPPDPPPEEPSGREPGILEPFDPERDLL